MAEADTALPAKAQRRTQAERSGTMRARLLDAAGELVRGRGFARLRMGNVAATAGVSIGALLHHFPTRNALVMALFEHLYGAIAEESKNRRTRAENVPQAIRSLIADARAFFLGDSFAASLDIAIASSRDEALRDQVLAIIARSRMGVEEMWVERLVALGIKRQAAVDALWIANSVFRGLAVRAIWDTDQRAFARMDVVAERVILADLGYARPPKASGPPK